MLSHVTAPPLTVKWPAMIYIFIKSQLYELHIDLSLVCSWLLVFGIPSVRYYDMFFIRILEVSVFPIGVGSRYDDDELVKLAGPSGTDKITKVQLFDDLPTMLLLRDDFINKLCTGKSTY